MVDISIQSSHEKEKARYKHLSVSAVNNGSALLMMHRNTYGQCSNWKIL